MAAPVATTKRSRKADTARDNRAPARAAAESEQAERTILPRTAPLAGFTGIRRVPAPLTPHLVCNNLVLSSQRHPAPLAP